MALDGLDGFDNRHGNQWQIDMSPLAIVRPIKNTSRDVTHGDKFGTPDLIRATVVHADSHGALLDDFVEFFTAHCSLSFNADTRAALSPAPASILGILLSEFRIPY